MQNNLRRLGLTLLALGLLAGAFGAGVLTGAESKRAEGKIRGLFHLAPAAEVVASSTADDVDFSPFWQAWKIVDDKFIDGHASATTSTSTPPLTAAEKNQQRVWGAITGMVDSLGDPYSVFLPPVEKKSFEEGISGNFGGVGIELDLKNKILTVVTALDDTPAKRAGILPGDEIMKIDGADATGLSIDEAVKLIRGEIGTKVVLTVNRAKAPEVLKFELIRGQITVPITKVESKDGVFIIRLFSFNANATNAFRQALRQFMEAGTDKLVVDLRGNPGGYLEAAVDIASWFLPVGKTIVTERGRSAESEVVHRSYGYNIFTDQLKMVILVDGGSASASEILAGALSEYGKGTLVGEKTFGKGSVQELVPVTDDSSLKITIAKWYTPNGVSISDNGLTPQVVVPRGEKDDEDHDTQLNKAIEIFNKK